MSTSPSDAATAPAAAQPQPPAAAAVNHRVRQAPPPKGADEEGGGVGDDRGRLGGGGGNGCIRCSTALRRRHCGDVGGHGGSLCRHNRGRLHLHSRSGGRRPCLRRRSGAHLTMAVQCRITTIQIGIHTPPCAASFDSTYQKESSIRLALRPAPRRAVVTADDEHPSYDLDHCYCHCSTDSDLDHVVNPSVSAINFKIASESLSTSLSLSDHCHNHCHNR